jgi:uncharacterized protein
VTCNGATPYMAHAPAYTLGEAKGKTQALASAGGPTLGAPLTVREGGSPMPVAYPEAMAARGSGAPPIEAGTQKIEASVTVTYSTS